MLTEAPHRSWSRPDLATNDRSAAARISVVVIDEVGAVFGTLRELGMTASLWRIVGAKHVANVSGLDLAVLAVYDQIDWSLADLLVERVPTLVMATKYSREEASTSLGHGLIGYLDASLGKDALRRAVAGALKGEPAYARDITGMWLRARRTAAVDAQQKLDLTPRQREIVALIARGATDKEIAGVLGIATATAQKHVTNILDRLNVPNRAAAVAAVAGHHRY